MGLIGFLTIYFNTFIHNKTLNHICYLIRGARIRGKGGVGQYFSIFFFLNMVFIGKYVFSVSKIFFLDLNTITQNV